MIKVLDLNEMKLLFPKMKVFKEKFLKNDELEIVFNTIEENKEYTFISIIHEATPKPKFIIRKNNKDKLVYNQ